jgi:hypothetical protein
MVPEKMHTEEFHDLYTLSIVIRMIMRIRTACMKEIRKAYRVLMRKPEKRRQLKGKGGQIILK